MVNATYAPESVSDLQKSPISLTVEDLAEGGLILSDDFYETANDWLIEEGYRLDESGVLSPFELTSFLGHCYLDIPQSGEVTGTYLTEHDISTTLYGGRDELHYVEAIRKEIKHNQKKLSDLVMDQEGNDGLVVANMHLVDWMIHGMGRANLPHVDALKDACMYELVSAANDYDPTKGNFTSMVNGKLKYALLDKDRKIRGRYPSDMQDRLSFLSTLTAEDIDPAEIVDYKTKSPFEITQRNDEGEFVQQAVSNLNRIERLTLKFYYEHEMTLKEVGEIVGVSESRICQIHPVILEKLRIRLSSLEN